ncbi:MAG: haloacid dehalogenase-like hydrolase [Acidobacteria bacterium]|nr:haloacid dehalogenase-like hydrolase [Acidobacteriota bacterium]
MPTLLLFDIDGTLITTGGAGYRTMKRAVEIACGVEHAMAGVATAGRTDSIILRDAMRALDGRPLTDDLLERIRVVYCDLLSAELERTSGGPGVLPGVRQLLTRLTGHPAYHLALLTGNFRQSAQIKLAYHALWRYFEWGAFGQDAIERNDLLPVALSRYQARTGVTIAAHDVVIIGDTPHDVGVARAGGVRSVCVTTGQYDRAALEQAGADVIFNDFSDVDEVMRVFGVSVASA